MGGSGAGVSGEWSGERSGAARGFESGELFSIYGVNLAAKQQWPLLLPLPATMAAASVQIDGIAAPLSYGSPLQINTQVPWEVKPGSATLTVTHTGVAVSQTVTIAAAGPAIFTLYGSQEGAALNQDYSVNAPNHPAAAGQAILLFGTGLGAVSPAAASADPLSWVTPKVTATVGGAPADVSFAGLAPGFAGLWQINVALPAGISDAVPVIVTVAGMASNAVTVWVK